jgi:hypothetical protein
MSVYVIFAKPIIMNFDVFVQFFCVLFVVCIDFSFCFCLFFGMVFTFYFLGMFFNKDQWYPKFDLNFKFDSDDRSFGSKNERTSCPPPRTKINQQR